MALVAGCTATAAAEPGVDAGGTPHGESPDEFFERRIRPVLVEHCYECHAGEASVLHGSLRVDSANGLRRGGDAGPAVVPGDPDASLLIQALRYETYEMPPTGQLPREVIADFEHWVAAGAFDPRAEAAPGTANAPAAPMAKAVDHWAYQPLRAVELPPVRDAAWPRTSADLFILARLEAEGLAPAEPAEPAALIRRAYLDLWGLPPTPADVEAYVRDPTPAAYERMVDALLASPRFGEHWGRHWLDVVRFAESLTLRGFVLPEAWRYRDYVIDALNADMPYRQFVVEQLAGDLLPAATPEQAQRQRIATTFLTLGNTNLEDQDKRKLELDVIDEQLDVIGKAFLAQTIACARCHDHKFDPIPTHDYYALAGILANVTVLKHANVSQWIEEPLPLSDEQEAAYRAVEEAMAAVQAQLSAAREQLNAHAEPSTVSLDELPGIVLDDSAAEAVGAWTTSQHTRPYLGTGYRHDGHAQKGEKQLKFRAVIETGGKHEVRMAYTPGANRATNVPVTVTHARGSAVARVNQQAAPPLAAHFASLGQFDFEPGMTAEVLVSTEGTDGHVVVDAVQIVPLAALAAEPAEAAAEISEARGALEQAIRADEAELKRLAAQLPPRPRAMTVVENAEIRDLAVRVRGNPHQLGPVVPRGVLTAACPGPAPTMPAAQSGRRELAEWIASPDNPLTARVLVNRVWHWLMGQGIVASVDNFGATGSRPTHPELLDHLAWQLITDEWSIKRLVRTIVLSSTYRQSTQGLPTAHGRDPENRLCARQRRVRLSAEAIRDAMLLAAGQLDLSVGGKTYPADLAQDYDYVHAALRRSVYVPAFRNSQPELFTAFDAANPSLVVGARDASITAPQALWMMNHPDADAWARATAARVVRQSPARDADILAQLYWICLSRSPTSRETALACQYVAAERAAGAGDPQESWGRVVQALFASAEFRYRP